MNSSDQPPYPDPSDREEIETFIKSDEDALPPIYTPDRPHPIGSVGILPGDVLAKGKHVNVVVDITDQHAVCYRVGDCRYTVYDTYFLDEDLEDGGLHYHENMCEVTATH